MNVKIECSCGTRFAFDVEPVNGRMPVNVNCPGCNASALELANAEIRRQLTTAAAPVAGPTPAIPPSPAPATVSPAAPQPPSPAQPAIRLSIPTPSAPRVNPAPASNPAVRVAAPAVQPSAQSSLRINKPAAHAAAPAAPTAPPPGGAPAAAAGGRFCSKHQNQLAQDTCRVCGKPICLKCMEQFGYICSVFCRQQAEAQGIKIPRCKLQRRGIEDKQMVQAQRIGWAVVGILLVMGGFWFWYAWFARVPKVVYSVPLVVPNPDSDKPFKPDAYYQLIGPGELLSVKNRELDLYDVPHEKMLWTAKLQSDAEVAAVKAAKAKNEEIMRLTPKKIDTDTQADITQYHGLDPLGFRDDFFFADPGVAVTTNDVWIWFSDRLLRFDRATGSPKDAGVKDHIVNVSYSGDMLLVLTHEQNGRETLTEITLPDGSSQNVEITPGKTNEVAAAKGKSATGKGTNRLDLAKGAAGKTGASLAAKRIDTGKAGRLSARSAGNAGATAGGTPAKPAGPMGTSLDALQAAAAVGGDAADDSSDDEFGAMGYYGYHSRDYQPASVNVAQFQSKMLEHKVITHESMAPKPQKKLMVDSDNLTAGKSLSAAVEMANAMTPQMSTEEDVSVYEVTLHRLFAPGAPDWTNQVTGEPAFFPLQTVDVVGAGKDIYVLDKNNKLLWKAKLTYNIPARSLYFSRSGDRNSQCLETKDSLYVADESMLTRFDLATGEEKWHLNISGVRDLKLDSKGQIYAVSEQSQGSGINARSRPVISKVDWKTGKELWSLESAGDSLMMSGKFIYTTRISTAMAFLKLEEGPDVHYNLNLINPSSGRVIWNYHAGNRHIVRTEVQQNWILLHFRDEVLVMKFWSL